MTSTASPHSAAKLTERHPKRIIEVDKTYQSDTTYQSDNTYQSDIPKRKAKVRFEGQSDTSSQTGAKFRNTESTSRSESSDMEIDSISKSSEETSYNINNDIWNSVNTDIILNTFEDNESNDVLFNNDEVEILIDRAITIQSLDNIETYNSDKDYRSRYNKRFGNIDEKITENSSFDVTNTAPKEGEKFVYSAISTSITSAKG